MFSLKTAAVCGHLFFLTTYFLTDFRIYSKGTFMYMMYMDEFQDKYIIYKHHHNVKKCCDDDIVLKR